MTNTSDKQGWSNWNLNPLVVEKSAKREPTLQQKMEESKNTLRQTEFKRQSEIEALREQARKEAYDAGFQKGHEDAFESGFEKGIAEGKTEGLAILHAETKKAVDPLLQLATNFTAGLAELDGQIATEVADLALKISKLLVGNSIKESPEQILAVVKKLIHHEPELTGKPKLHLHPDDFAIVHEHLNAEIEGAGWSLRSNELITRGGCKVISKSGDLDATMESRWAQIEGEFNRFGGSE